MQQAHLAARPPVCDFCCLFCCFQHLDLIANGILGGGSQTAGSQRCLVHGAVVDAAHLGGTNEELFKEISARLKSEAKARSFRLNSSHISAEHPFVKRAVKLGRVPFGSPTLSDQALMKFPSVKIGPGKSSRSHTADEYIMVSEIEEAIRLYIEMLDGLVL